MTSDCSAPTGAFLYGNHSDSSRRTWSLSLRCRRLMRLKNPLSRPASGRGRQIVAQDFCCLTPMLEEAVRATNASAKLIATKNNRHDETRKDSSKTLVRPVKLNTLVSVTLRLKTPNNNNHNIQLSARLAESEANSITAFMFAGACSESTAVVWGWWRRCFVVPPITTWARP